ncbi:M1 family metallopeptidase [Wenzhouxiangella marina]|uniref:Aminopeptidase N n=1 Tax=Wenzhouxiangella marina TaxID=1579979 RepID=A0A0K0XZM7_9GAMM|nr:M1 family metallopeptidase [Wenzhouxiangella marina]AKS43076.1 Putative cold-active aminopeptidase [Wenzhouxiangella marina]MBB6087240.1 aminopeptidase N [Wenzhouxiangella marina]
MTISRIALLAMMALGLSACQNEAPPVPLTPTPEMRVELGSDPHSFAEYEKVRIRHMSLDLDADMDARTLSGHVLLDLERLDPDHQRLVLDTRDLDIQDVTVVDPEGQYLPVSWRLGADRGHLGRPLVIMLPQGVDQVRIDYSSSPEAFGLQWLDANQTSSGKPFMFSQSQPHYARTWVPLQDTPAVRYNFEATVRAPRDLMVVMGADGNPTERNASGEYRFTMPQPVPSYLMAIAIGDLEFAEIGPRSGVYAEPDWIERAAAEFHQLEDMIDIGEALYGEYRWGRYDLLVLPPSFPFGGMENPRLSYVTPTIIAGDGSLLALVAHELAHSWSGNLVTNSAWRDLWLNEGFTVYFEARIMEAIYSPEIVAMLARLDWDGLVADLPALEERDRQLVRDLSDRDPEGAFISVPYDMGRFFLDWLEHRVGREDLDVFLRQYFDEFAFESIDTETFRDYLNTHLIQTHPGALTLAEVDAWLYEPGLPDFAVAPESDALATVDQWRERWQAGEVELTELPTDDWSVYEWLHFLSGLEGALDADTMAAMDAAFGLTASSNVEILYLWLQRSIEAEYAPGIERLESFLLEVGRNKFTRPLYTALAASPWGHDWAIEVYQRARPAYHPLTRQAAERALGLEQ